MNPSSRAPEDNRAVSSDEQLIARTASGDHTAFEALVSKYQGPALNLAYRLLGDPAEAEEAVQETFLRVYRNAGRFHPAAPFRAWFFQILANICKDTMKKSKPVYGSVLPDRASPQEGAAASFERRQREQTIGRELARLPVNQRLALLLSFVEDLSYRDIAHSLNVSIKSVESLLVRAKKTMRWRLSGYL